MPTIRIDKDVYEWLKSQAVPFEDSPNSVLRRLAGLDNQESEKIQPPMNEPHLKVQPPQGELKMTSPITTAPKRPLSGKILKERWNVDVKHALYHWEGTFYQHLERFPGALFDIKGYVIFETREAYENSPYLSIGDKRLNVRDGISSMPGYKRMR